MGSFLARDASYSCKKYMCRSERSASVGYSVAILDHVLMMMMVVVVVVVVMTMMMMTLLVVVV